MNEKRKINRNATIENIRQSGNIVYIEEFNSELEKPDSEEFIVDAAMFCDVQVVYET